MTAHGLIPMHLMESIFLGVVSQSCFGGVERAASAWLGHLSVPPRVPPHPLPWQVRRPPLAPPASTRRGGGARGADARGGGGARRARRDVRRVLEGCWKGTGRVLEGCWKGAGRVHGGARALVYLRTQDNHRGICRGTQEVYKGTIEGMKAR